MINSVTFPETGQGYLYRQAEKPGPKPNKNESYRYGTYGYTQEQYEKDKSLDITSVCKLYREILPMFQERFGIQIIMVSHSPIFVMDGMRNNERFNIIDMDSEYSKECIEGIRALNG